MMYPVIGAYRLDDKVRIEIDGVLREGKIICIGLNGYVVAADACVFVVNDPQIKWCARTSGEDEPTDEIKCGDKVHVIRSANLAPASGIDLFRRNISLVTRIKDGIASLYIIDEYGLNHYAKAPIEDLVKVFKDESDKDKSHNSTISIPAKVDLDDTYWDAYKAELASKIAVAYAEKGRFAPDEIGGFAVRVANDVVDNLKKQEQC